MELSKSLVDAFVKTTNDEKETRNTNSLLYGKVVEQDGSLKVKMDGSGVIAPAVFNVEARKGDRVSITIEDHTVKVVGNITAPPSSRTATDLNPIIDKINLDVSTITGDLADFKTGEFENLKSDIATFKETTTDSLTATNGKIDSLTGDVLNFQNGEFKDLKSDVADFKETTTEKLNATDADIENLKADKISATDADLKFATIENLNTTNATIKKLDGDYGNFKETTTDKLKANDAEIESLKTDKISAKDADLKYANIDFSNIGQAAMEYFYAKSGLIKDVVVGNETITGELVGVTIRGDLIEGNTIVADKLVIKGNDGLYYKLNTNGVTTEAEQTDYNSLNGQIIRAKSVTAEKISVEDLVAFGATIGGMHISEDSLYSGVKNSVDNTTRGFYFGKDGQVAFGDSSNYLKYYKDSDGKYKLAISTESFEIKLGNQNLNETIEDIKSEINDVRDEITTILYIDSSQGIVFKNNAVSTVLSVIIYHGNTQVTDMDKLKEVFGTGAYLQWKWERLNEDSYGIISANDSRIIRDGFGFVLSPEDVDVKVNIKCDLIV